MSLRSPWQTVEPEMSKHSTDHHPPSIAHLDQFAPLTPMDSTSPAVADSGASCSES